VLTASGKRLGNKHGYNVPLSKTLRTGKTENEYASGPQNSNSEQKRNLSHRKKKSNSLLI